LLSKSHWEELVEGGLWCAVTWGLHPSCIFRVAFAPARCPLPVLWQKLNNAGYFTVKEALLIKVFHCEEALLVPVTPSLAFMEGARPRQEPWYRAD